MEYNPAAINEVLAYGFQTRKDGTLGGATYTNRVFIELVNTLTAAYNPTYDSTGDTDHRPEQLVRVRSDQYLREHRR